MSKNVKIDSKLVEAVQEADGTVLVGPSFEFLTGILFNLFPPDLTNDEIPEIHIVTDEPLIPSLRKNVLTHVLLGELSRTQNLTVHITNQVPTSNSLLVQDELYKSNDIGSETIIMQGVVEDPDQFSQTVFESAVDIWRPSKPSYTELISTAGDRVGDDFAATLDSELRSFTDRETAPSLVALVVLIGAKHEVLQYDLARWLETQDIFSPASLSRKKSDLVDEGVIRYSTVEQDVGRPREQLHLRSEAGNLPELLVEYC